MRAEHAGELGLLAERQRAGRAEAGQGVQGGVLVIRQDPTHVGLLRDLTPVRGLRRGQPHRRVDGRVRPLQRRLDGRIVGGPWVEPEVETVVHGDVQRTVHEDVLQPGPGAGQWRHGNLTTRLGAQRAEQRVGQVPGDVAGLLVALETDEHPTVRLGDRRGGHRQHRGERRRPVTELLDQGGRQPQRGGGGGHQLAQRDPLGLVDQPVERTRHEDVPHLVATGGGLGGGALALSTLAHGVTA